MCAQHSQPARSQQEITDALVAVRNGAPRALERLLPLVYEQLRQLAHRQLGAERPDHTFSTTDLVHEAYIRLVDQSQTEWVDRAHFFAVAARSMRRILVDYARRHRALRRGGTWRRISFDEGVASATAERADELVALDEALDRLSRLDERLSRVVECRYFGGFTEAETAEVLGVTPRTVARDWVKAKGWLYDQLRPSGA